MSIKTGLIEEFNSELEELKKMEVGTDEYKTSVEGITKLADRIIEIEKQEHENSARAIDRQVEMEFKEQQLIDEKRDRIIKNCLTGLSVVGGLGLTFVTAVMSMNFEREGTFTTEAGRGSIRQLLKFKW